MLHCIALPFLLIALPFFEEFARNHFHLQLLVFVLPVSIFALTAGFRRHRHRGIPISGAIGMLLLIVGATWAHQELGLAADRLTTIAGSLILATSHFFNSQLSKRHRRQTTGRCS